MWKEMWLSLVLLHVETSSKCTIGVLASGASWCFVAVFAMVRTFVDFVGNLVYLE
jgi:hypothetical protein